MSFDPVTFTVAGDPQGKGRARAFRKGNFIGHYTPAKTRSYEGMVRFAAQEAMLERMAFPIEAPVHVDIRAVFAVPPSWSGRKRSQALIGAIRPAKKPDMDNIVKAVTDACNGVVYRDDALIVSGNYSKVYGPAAMVVITVRAAVLQPMAA